MTKAPQTGSRQPEPATDSPATPSPSSPNGAFPIIGIGASAGGLEALEQFLRSVPADSGMAFVVVQHLDPTHQGLLPELLQRATVLPVERVADRVKVRPNHVYVIRPNKDLSLMRGALHLSSPRTCSIPNWPRTWRRCCGRWCSWKSR